MVTATRGISNSNIGRITYNAKTYVPWYKIETPLDGPRTSDEMVKAAGLDWGVRLEPIRTASGIEIPGKKAIVRTDNGHPFEVVSDQYKPLTNADAFRFFDEATISGKAIYEGALTFKDGAVVVVMARLPQVAEIVKGDVMERVLMLVNSFDKTFSVRANWLDRRFACWNMLAGIINGMKNFVSIPHRGNLIDRFNDARVTLGVANQYFDATADLYRHLARERFTDEEKRDFLKALFPEPERPKVARPDFYGRYRNAEAAAAWDRFDRAVEKAQIAKGEVYRLADTGLGHEVEGIRGTKYAMLNAVTQWVDHQATTNNETRAHNVLFGTGMGFKQQALALLAPNAAKVSSN